MNINTYTTEKLMQQREAAIQKRLRKAWMLGDTKAVRPSLLTKLIARWDRKKEAVTTAVSEACCSCCPVNA
jgi:hypothetical protein